jgi:hypothetical protein
MLAIVTSFEYWRHYLDSAVNTEVYTNYQNLKKFMEQTQLNSQQTQWLVKLLPYSFHLFYRKRSLNPADTSSRRPDYLDEVEEVSCIPVSTLSAFKEKITLHNNLDKQLGTDTQPEHILHTKPKMTSQPVEVGSVN